MKITLSAWAARNFDPAPCMNTLRAWAKSGLISPAAMKIGRTWMVDEDAVYKPLPSIEEAGPMSDRVKAILRGF